jgi:hypothetical protein
MKTFCLTLSLLIGGLLLSPAAMAQQYGMDDSYNQGLNDQAQGSATQSGGSQGAQSYTTFENGWQDQAYVQGQQQAAYIPGILRANPQVTQFGTNSGFVGNTGQFLKGASTMLGKALPQTHMNLNALTGGYNGYACGEAGSGGFYGLGNVPSTSMYRGFALPPTSTSTVDLNTAY